MRRSVLTAASAVPSWLLSLSLLVTLLSHCHHCKQPPPFNVVFEWKQLDFAWRSPEHKSNAIGNESYVPENCLLSDVKLLDGQVYVTVPRWRHGVPASLNRLADPSQRSPLLEPYPNWAMNEPDDVDCAAIQYAHAIEIDPRRRMWIVDSGKWGTFTRPVTRCPAKLIVWDMMRRREVRRFVFSDDLVDRSQSLLSSIVLDTTSTASDEWHAYIASTGESRLLVYSWRTNSAWYLSHRRSMSFDHSAIMIQSQPPVTLPLGIFTLALSPHKSLLSLNYDHQYNDNHKNPSYSTRSGDGGGGLTLEHRLFYAPLASYQFYSVPTSLLRNRSEIESLPDPGALDSQWHRFVQRVGVRSSQSAAMTVSSDGVMFYSVLNNNAINSWNLTLPFSALDLVYRDVRHLQWPAAFGWGAGGYLYFSSNRMQQYVRHDLHRDRVNFRIMRAQVKTTGYMGAVGAAALWRANAVTLVVAVAFGSLTARLGLSNGAQPVALTC